MTFSTAARPRVALVGARGFGGHHLRNLRRLADRVELVAVADPAGALPGTIGDDVPVFATLDSLLDSIRSVDVVIIATPIHTHFSLVDAALRAGADVLVEKPPFASQAQFERVVALQKHTGRAVQVGFQSLGSLAVPAIRRDDFGIGPVHASDGLGLWVRARSYWSRSDWAGQRTLDGEPVTDGVSTNAFAHAVVTALAVVGARTLADIARVDVDLYHANEIDGDDTSSLRIVTSEGVVVTCALTLCAPSEVPDPSVRVHGTRGSLDFRYTLDRVTADGIDHDFARADLLENLLEHRAGGVPLLSSLEDSGAFIRVLEAIRLAPEPGQIPGESVADGEESRVVVPGVEQWSKRAVDNQATFQELGAPWARARADSVVAELSVAKRTVATLVDGDGTAPSSVRRPYLHPVTTRRGVVVTDAHPADHDWHLGAGLAIPGVNDSNLWGGPSYTASGYRRLGNHGRVRSLGVRHGEGRLVDELEWVDRDGAIALTESRRLAWTALDEGWRLDWVSTFTAATEVEIESPATAGRQGAGYGGFFWRLAPCTDVAVRTGQAVGEDAVTGTISPWLAWSAHFPQGPATLVFSAPDSDPWFVRERAYCGVGTSFAATHPLALAAGATLSRSLSVVVADGILDDRAVARLAGSHPPTSRPGEHQ